MPKEQLYPLIFASAYSQETGIALNEAPMPSPVHEPAPMPPPMPEPVHAAQIDLESHDGEPDEDHMRAEFVSAPVSRGDHAHSIEPQLSPSTVRLSPEQRDMAHRSMPHLSPGEAETTYAAGLLKMNRMKKSKLIE